MVKLRLKRFGRKNHAFWRINAVDHRSPRDGKVIEELGFYDPINPDTANQVVVNKERVDFWTQKRGAQPSDTVRQLLDPPPSIPQAELTAAEPAHCLSDGESECWRTEGTEQIDSVH